MRFGHELCESAKKGHACPDDLCRGADVTLCGFDKNFYEACIADDNDGPADDFDDSDHCLDCGGNMNYCGCPRT